jgi:hypothetical protein
MFCEPARPAGTYIGVTDQTNPRTHHVKFCLLQQPPALHACINSALNSGSPVPQDKRVHSRNQDLTCPPSIFQNY